LEFQIIQVIRDQLSVGTPKIQRLELKIISKHIGTIVRSALIGVGIGACRIGEDIAAWVSYGAAKPQTPGSGKGEYAGAISCETAITLVSVEIIRSSRYSGSPPRPCFSG
jgi:TctA family transporter